MHTVKWLKQINYRHTLNQFRAKCKWTMNETVFIRHFDGDDTFKASFQYKCDSLNVNRQFNFQRNIFEPLEIFVNRIQTNLNKILIKKVKKKKKKINDDIVETFHNDNSTIVVTKNGISISKEIKCNDLFFSDNELNNLQFEICGNPYNVIVNSPWIDNIELPSSLMSGFPVYPSKFDIVFSNIEKSDMTWYISNVRDGNKPLTWTEIGKGFMFNTLNDHIGCFLKITCTPSNGKHTGPLIECQSTSTIQAGPGTCPFEKRHSFTNERLDNNGIRVVTYNILADLYAETETAQTCLFPYCPQYAMNIDYRKQLYIKELLGYNADIICLQEVDSKIFKYDLQYVLGKQDMNGLFTKKGETQEGIAVFYNTKKFKCDASHKLVLGEQVDVDIIFEDIWKSLCNSEAVKRLKDLFTTVQVAVLELVDKQNEKIIVANTHLYFHPNADHIRLLQGGIAMKYLEKIVNDLKIKEPNSNISIIFCGDFNSSPDCGIFQLMTTNHVPKNCKDWSSNESEIIKDLELNQPFSMSSACGTPKYTNFTSAFSGCLDYIFYQTDRLKVMQVVPFPSEEELKENTAIPSIVFPSDHIAQIVDFQWK